MVLVVVVVVFTYMRVGTMNGDGDDGNDGGDSDGYIILVPFWTPSRATQLKKGKSDI